MKLRRLMQNCPSRTKLTKGQRCASQQNWLANGAVGHSRPIDRALAVVACPLRGPKRTNSRSPRYVRLVPIVL
jgi:hypothetical protein